MRNGDSKVLHVIKKNITEKHMVSEELNKMFFVYFKDRPISERLAIAS